MAFKKLLYITLVTFSANALATIDDTVGVYQPGLMYGIPYYSYGPLHYYNTRDNYYWTGQEWILKTGYEIGGCCDSNHQKDCNYCKRCKKRYYQRQKY